MRHFFVAFLIALLASCNSEKEGTYISGTIQGYGNQQVFFQSSLFTDSVITDNDGAFELPLTITEPTFVRLTDQSKQLAAILMIAPNEQTNVTVIDSSEWQNGFSVKGSAGSEKLVELNNHYNKSLAAIENIRKEYNKQMQVIAPSSDEHRILSDLSTAQYDSVVNGEKEYLINFINANVSSFVAISALYQTFDYRTGRPIVLNDEDGFKYFDRVDSALMLSFPTAQDLVAFHKNYIQVKQEIERQKTAELSAQKNQLKVGDVVPEISLPNPSGTQMNLSSLRGKYVLLDFWASWCAPCRMENPSLVTAHKQYASKGFQIFQVSLDKTKEAWIKAIEKDGLYWKYHVSDLQYWNSAVAKQFGIQSIPANYLLDKNGVVIEMNLRGEDLMKKLAELL